MQIFVRISLCFLLLCLPKGILSAKEYKYEVALCAIFQNEASYLREWIEFHKIVGVTHFYLFNNLSSDHYQEVLQPYMDSGEVELFQWNFASVDVRSWNDIQCSAYGHAIKLSKKKVKWLAILDMDEFLFPVKVNTLPEFLKNYSKYGAVAANWQMYGTSGVEKILPGQLMIEELIYKGLTDRSENKHVKSIVRPKYVSTITNPHFCILVPGMNQVNADKESFVGAFTPVKIDKIRINHYWTRDEDFFWNHKLARRLNWGDNVSLEGAAQLNEEVDLSIHKYLPKLRATIERFK